MGALKRYARGVTQPPPLIPCVLHEKQPSLAQAPRRLRQQFLDDLGATSAGAKRLLRFMRTDLGRQLPVGDGRHVWQVGNNEVEADTKRFQQCPLDEVNAPGHAVCRGIAPRQLECRPRPIDRDDASFLQLMSQSHSDSPVARPHVSDNDSPTAADGAAPMLPPLAAHESDSVFDQQLSLRPGDDGGGRALQVDSVELSVSNDVARRLSGEPTGEQGLEGRPLVHAERLPKSRKHSLAADVKCMGEEDFCLQARIFDLTRPEPRRSVVQRFG